MRHFSSFAAKLPQTKTGGCRDVEFRRSLAVLPAWMQLPALRYAGRKINLSK